VLIVALKSPLPINPMHLLDNYLQLCKYAI
jgi:hypothetical protein